MRQAAVRQATVGAIAVLAIVAAAVLAPRGGSARVAANTWAGTWNTDFGVTTLDAGGSGHYAGFNPGDIHGSVKGNVDQGTWTQPGNPPKNGTFKFTLGADGHSWTGEWAYAAGGCGSSCGWNGTCTGGACLKNSPGGGDGGGTGHCAQRRPQSRAALKEVRVVSVKPDVQWHCEGSPTDAWQELKAGTVLKQGDEISCDPDGSAVLAFADNSTVTVSNTTQLKIASFFAEGGVVRTQILLRMGEVAATVNKSETTKSDFKIQSPTEVDSVRGTIFSVFYDPVSRASLTDVRRGVVAVDPAKPGLKTVSVVAGKEVEVTAAAESKIAPLGKAGARGGVNRMRAHDLVVKVVARENGPCGVTTPRSGAFSVKPAAGGWLVSVRVAGKLRGWTTWSVTGTKVKPLNALAVELAGGC